MKRTYAITLQAVLTQRLLVEADSSWQAALQAVQEDPRDAPSTLELQVTQVQEVAP